MILRFNQFNKINEAKKITDLDKNISLYIKEDVNIENYSKLVNIILYDKSITDIDTSLIGAITIGICTDTGFSPHSAYKVIKSAVNESYKGYGPVLYDIAIQYTKETGLMPDRSVSKDAKKIWEYYFNNRTDIHKKPVDNFRNPLTPDKTDDGKLTSPFSKSDSNAYPKDIADTSYINHVYYTDTIQYDSILKNHNKTLEADLIEAKNRLFLKRID